MFTAIKDAIATGNFTQAIVLANNDPYLLSLIYRAQFDYPREIEYLNLLIQRDPQNAYANERLVWHKLPMGKKMVHKKPFRSNYTSIDKNVLDQTVFVLACNSNPLFFNLTLECIDSILCIKEYENVPIFILDMGLNEKDLGYLQQKSSRITISNLESKIQAIPNLKTFIKDHHFTKLMGSRVFLNKLLDQYKYYFIIDGDGWIQDGYALDLYLTTVLTQGCASANTIDYDKENVPKGHSSLLANAKLYSNLGFVCLDRDKFPFDEWQRIFLEYGSEEAGIDEWIFNYILNNTFHTSLLPRHTNFSMNFPTILPHIPDRVILCDDHMCLNTCDSPIGFVHFAGKAKEMSYFQNAKVLECKTNQTDILNKSNIFFNIGNNRGSYPDKIFYSPHFYMFPQEEKIVLSILEKENAKI